MQGKYQAGKGLAEALLEFDETKPTIATLRRLFRRVFPVPYENCEIGGPRSVYQGFPSLEMENQWVHVSCHLWGRRWGMHMHTEYIIHAQVVDGCKS